MLSYLTDATLFWAVSLLCYVLFFRKTTFHGWNRAVLLITLLAGFLLPFWPQPAAQTASQIPVYIQMPVTRLSAAKTEAIAEISASVKPVFSFSLWTVYYAGCALAALFYVRAATLLFRIIHKARKREISGKSIYETGIVHTPFSFFGKTFLTDASRYAPVDLQLILEHEARHGAFRHSADVVVLAALRIVLWFHPFIYLYDYFLKQVHEFQADAFARDQVRPYGYLLLQEATSNPFPLVHSFHHSPLKSRIVMLTKNTTPALLKIAYLLLIPALLLTVEACKKKEPVTGFQTLSFPGDTVFYFRGNKFVREDGTKVGNWNGAGRFESSGAIKKMNGEPVYFQKDLDLPARYIGPATSAFQELCRRILPSLQSLPDGEYSIIMGGGEEVISKEGALALYGNAFVGTGVTTIADLAYIQNAGAAKVQELSEASVRPVIQAINKALEEGFEFSPAIKDGKPVNSIVFQSIFTTIPHPTIIKVKSGQVTFGAGTAQRPSHNKQDIALVKQQERNRQESEKAAAQTRAKKLKDLTEVANEWKTKQHQQEAEAAIAQAKAAEAMVQRSTAEIKKAEAEAARWKAVVNRHEVEKSLKR